MALALSGNLAESTAHLREALPRLAESGDRQTEVSCMSSLAFVLLYRGHRADGERWMGKMLAAARAIGARAQEAYGHWVTSELVETYGDWGVALQEASTGLAIARAIDHREWTVAALAVLGRVHRNCGDIAGARRYHDEMLALARDLRTTLWIAEALGETGQNLGFPLPAEGRRQLGEAVELAGEAVKFGARALLGLANLAFDQDRPEEALEAARRTQRALSEFAVFASDARRLEGQALLALGRADEAEAVLRRANTEAATLGVAPAEWRANLALARLLVATGRADEAREPRAEARRLLEKVATGLTGVPALLRGFKATPAYREAFPA
jgi:tetratricopeptide (TPR) repeat protein